jgi:Carboxypeptidase regulatory-like domain
MKKLIIICILILSIIAVVWGQSKFVAFNQQKLELGIIKGQIVDTNGKPIEGAKVYAFSPNKSFEGRIKYFISDEKGLFIISNVQNGKYGIHAFSDEQGYSDTMFAFYVTPQNSIPTVEVKDGQTIENIVIKLEEKTTLLSGKVIDENSKDLTKEVSRIELCREDNPDACIFISPNLKAGQFQIAVPVTKIKIKVTAENYKEIETVENFAATEGKELILEIARAN